MPQSRINAGWGADLTDENAARIQISHDLVNASELETNRRREIQSLSGFTSVTSRFICRSPRSWSGYAPIQSLALSLPRVFKAWCKAPPHRHDSDFDDEGVVSGRSGVGDFDPDDGNV